MYFVKISPNAYYKDLNNDGNFEIAIFPMLAGNNPSTQAYIYSIVGTNLIFYGKTYFDWESKKQ